MFYYYFAMLAIVASSNYFVQFPINDWVTWGGLFYPMTFLVTELVNRFQGSHKARQVVYVGFCLAVVLSVWLATPRIALASGAAFLFSQLLDITVFNKLRQGVWWKAPLYASALGSILDSAIFWVIAFWGVEGVPFFSLAIGGTIVKLAVDLAMLTPFRLIIRRKLQKVQGNG